MFKRNFCWVLLLASCSPAAVLALGLGDIHLKSALNSPLDAEIDLVGASPEDLAGLKASLASRDAFTRSGLDYPGYLGTLTFAPEKSADGHSVIHLRSTDPVLEPFATLLIQVDWARGHLVREYTVLLDPPLFSSESQSSVAVTAPSTDSGVRSGAVERSDASSAAGSSAAGASTPDASQPAAAATTPPSSSSSSSSSSASSSPSPSAAAGSSGAGSSETARSGAMAGGSYTVRRGDTLSSIATQAYAGSERGALARQLVAIYRANSSAFQGNMNVLRSGARLTLPGDAEVAAIGPGEASAEVRQQYAAWNSARVAGSGTGNSGQLRLVPPQDGAQAPASAAAGPQPGGAQAAGGGNSAALTQKVQQLQSQLQDSQRQLSESQRLLQMRNEELAALQARIAQSATNPAPAASGKPAAPVAVTPPPPPAPVNPPAAISAPPSSASSPTAVPAPSETATPSTPPPPPPKAAASKPKVTPAAAGESGNSMLDLIEEYWYVPAGLLAVLIALLVLRYVRSRQEDEFDRSLGRLQPSFEPASSTTLRTGADTIPVRALAASREPSYRVEESGSHEAPVFDDAPEHVSTVATGEHVAMDETHAGPAVALDQGDPLAEADFHMAYGLYDQAADLVQIAIAREPGRRDLRLKLLEVFFVWGNKDRFLQSARELSASRSAALPGEWEKIVIMGRQIAPEDPLFANTGALTGAAIGGVDLNLEGGQNRVDFDLLGEPSVSGAVDLDLGAALGDTDPTGEARKIGDSGVDFVLDDPQRGNDATGSTREMLGATSATTVSSKARAGGGATATMKIANGGGESELPTVEQPQLRGLDNPTIRQKIDAARTGLAAGEQTAELALDDLGLDLGTLEAGADDAVMPGGADAPTMLAGVDEDTRRILARAEAERAQAERAEVERAEAARADAERAQAERVAAEGVVAERAAAERAAHAKTQKSPGLAPTSTGTWLFSDSDFASVVPGAKPASNGRAAADAPTELVTQIATQQITATPELDTGSTSRMAKIDTSDLDLDFADLNDEQAVNGIDLDVGVASAGEGTFVQTQKIAPDEMPLPDLEPATMSEVGTKLDLARAYMDMGDPEGARSILGEVLSEGSVSQKQEARRLMDTLPG